MAIAKVNIENVEVFRQSIETQRNAISDNVEIVNSTVNEAKETVNLEKEKALALIDEVQETLSTLKIKIDEQQNKVDQLQVELSALEASEPTPAEELVVEPDEYDEEGNLISVGSSYYEETSAHISWRNEVAKLEGELQDEEARLSKMQAVEGKLQSILTKVEQEQAKLEEIYSKLEANQEEINAQKNSFEGFSEDATDKLNKINAVLQEYLSITIPICANISYVGGTSSYSLPATLSKSTTPYFTYSGASGTHKLYEDEVYADIVTDPTSRKIVEEILNDNISNEWGMGRKNAYLTTGYGDQVRNNHLIFHHLVKLKTDSSRFDNLAELLGRPPNYYEGSLIGARHLTEDAREVIDKATRQGNLFHAKDGKDWYLFEGDDNSAVVIIKDDKKETIYCNPGAARTFNINKAKNLE